MGRTLARRCASSTIEALEPVVMRTAEARTWMFAVRSSSLGRRFAVNSRPVSRFESHFLRPDHEMDHAIRRGDEEAVEIFAQLLDFVATRDAVNFQK